MEFSPENYNPSSIRPEILGIVYHCFLSEKVQKMTLKLLALEQFTEKAQYFKDHGEFENDGFIKNPITGQNIDPRFFLYSLYLISKGMTEEQKTEAFGELRFEASDIAYGTLHVGDLWIPLLPPPKEENT